MKITKMLFAASSAAVVLTLAGCWDDDDDPVAVTPPITAVPDSAGVSTAAFIGFIMSLGANDETSEPLTIGNTFSVPPDESAEPTPLT